MSAYGSILDKVQSLFSITDEQAMWRVQTEDDPRAFALLVERHQPAIQSLCTRMLGDAHRAEDLAQEAFARIYAKRKVYEASAKFSTYLWRVALNLCYDDLRRRKRRGEVSLDQETDGGFSILDGQTDPQPHPAESAEGTERAEIVRRVLMQMPEAYRTVLVLRHYEDLKFREIAEVLEIPEGTVKSRMAEAMTILTRTLQRAFREPPQGFSPAARPNKEPELMML